MNNYINSRHCYHNGTHKSNCMLVISSIEFRQNQKNLHYPFIKRNNMNKKNVIFMNLEFKKNERNINHT